MTTATETLSPSTFTICHIETPEGKKFLRKVIRDNQTLDWQETWSVRANARTHWKLEFQRTIKGEIGDPDRTVTVMTDLEVRVNCKPGETQSFNDSKPVCVRECTGIHINRGDCVVLCNLLKQKNPHMRVIGHAGSTASSQHGLSFYGLYIHTDDLGGSVLFGYETVAVNGRPVCSGTVSIG